MDFKICYYYVDNNPGLKFDTIIQAKEYARELAKELHYYPSIKFVALIID